MFNKVISIIVILSFALTNSAYGMPVEHDKSTLRAPHMGNPEAPVDKLANKLKALGQEELAELYEAQEVGDWRTIQKTQPQLRATLLAIYQQNWEEFKRMNPYFEGPFDIKNRYTQTFTITPGIANGWNLRTHPEKKSSKDKGGHLAEFDEKSDASTAGIRAFYDILHSENPNYMYNDLFLALLVEAEAEFLQEVHKDIRDRLDAIKDMDGFIADLRQNIGEENIEIIEEIYGMELPEIIEFVRYNVVKLVGGEVRPHTAESVEMETRILADKGIKVIVPKKYSDSVTIFMYSFLSYLLGATGATHYTPSHSSTYMMGRKVLAPDGSQLLPELYGRYREILKRIIDVEIYEKGAYTVRMGSVWNGNIMRTLSYERMVKLYRSILNISEEDIRDINEATEKGHRITLNCLNGAAWKTLLPLLQKLGINPEVFELLYEDEDGYFNAGYIVTRSEDKETDAVTYSVDHLGVDTTMPEVVNTIPYAAMLEGQPTGRKIYELDPDVDRFVIKQILERSDEVMNLLVKYGIDYYELDDNKILVAPSPNKTFLMLDIVDYERMLDAGIWPDYLSLYFITFVSSRAWCEFAEAVDGLIRIMSRVGFKCLSDLRKAVEDWYFNRPDEYEFTFKDHLDREITIDRSKKIRIHSKAEESGGRVAGLDRPCYNILGQKVLAMPEKSAVDSLLSELVFASKLYNNKIEGDYSVLKFIDDSFEKYGLKSRIDARIDLFHGNQGEIAQMDYEQRQVALKKAGAIKTNFNNFFFSLAKAVRDGQKMPAEARKILASVLPAYKDTWACVTGMTLAEEPLAGGRTRPEGAPIVFEARGEEIPMVTEFDFRPSATDPLKSKIYIDAERLTSEQKAQIKAYFTALTGYDLYAVLEHFGIDSIETKPANLNELGLKTLELEEEPGTAKSSSKADAKAQPAESIKALSEEGQSAYYDGALTVERFEHYRAKGAVGQTTNLTIIYNAIEAGMFDEQIAEGIKTGKNAKEIYDSVVMSYIRAIAEKWLPAHEETGHLDGYVSIEVNPDYAYDTEKTVEEAQRLVREIGMPNVMVKVPATKEGVKAIEELTYLGINVNVTLLFGTANYIEIAKAYIKGLKRRLDEDKDISNIQSVASFFVSRVNCKPDCADAQIKDLIEKAKSANDTEEAAKLEGLLGKAAIANAILAYEEFKKLFYTEEFKALQKKGANFQRLLWASTGVKKNEEYADGTPYHLLTYVVNLPFEHTINTMPKDILDALIQADDISPEERNAMDAEQAQGVFAELEKRGISIQEITAKLQRNGVESFAGDYVKSLIRFEDEIRQSKIEITEEAEEMLEQIHKYTGLPIKTKAATLDYLRSKGNLFFDSWEDVFNYFAALEFETDVYQVRDVKRFDEEKTRVFAAVTDETGIAREISTFEEVKKGRKVADEIPGTEIIRAMEDDKEARGALSKSEIRPISALSVAMIDESAIAQTKGDERPAYFMQRGVFASRRHITLAFETPNKLRFDLTIMRPGVSGKENELVHTSGHYHKPKWKPEIYQVVYGKAGYPQQNTKENLGTPRVKKPADINRAIVVEAEAGEPVVILPGFGHVTINLNPDKLLVMVNWLTYDQESQYGAFRRGEENESGKIIGIGGACWYAVLKDGKVVYKPNPNLGPEEGKYHNIPKLEVVKPAPSVPLLGLKKGVPIYSIVSSARKLETLARYLNDPLSDEFKEITPENVFEPVREIPGPTEPPAEDRETPSMGGKNLDADAVEALDKAKGAWAELIKTPELEPKAVTKAIDEVIGHLGLAIEGDVGTGRLGFKEIADSLTQQGPKQKARRNQMLATHMRSDIQTIIYGEGKLTEDKSKHGLILPATDETIAQFKLAEQTGELKAIEENTGIKIIINDDTEGAVNQLKEDADISPDNIIAFAFEGQEKTAKDILGEQNVFRMKEIQQFQYVPFSLLAMLVKAKLIAQSLEERQRGPYKSALEIIWRRLTGKEDGPVNVDAIINNPTELILKLLGTPKAVLDYERIRYLHQRAADAWA